MAKVLLIDDDHKLGQLLTAYFKQFDLDLAHALKPSEGFQILSARQYDIVILDVMLPEMDGFEVCRQLRSQPQIYGQIPIIMLTARGDVTDRIVGLEIGADDYLPKPFEPRELVARIHNILRRTLDKTTQAPTSLISKDLTLDTVSRSVLLKNQPVELTTMEYELLVLLMQHPNKAFSRDEIMNALRGIDANLYSRAVDTLISRLRHKIKDTSKTDCYIKTIWGTGYAFIGKVES